MKIRNPLLHLTKTEVIAQIVNAGLAPVIPETHSCWIARQANHCGLCVPCLVRRFAAAAAGAPDVTYQHDVFTTPPPMSDDHAANIGDYLLFVSTLNAASDDDLLLDFSELNIEGGPVAQAPVIDTHRRWASDVTNVANAHLRLAALL